MALQQESISHGSTDVSVGVQSDSVVSPPTVLTPRMVLSWLPRSATPAQQDSAIQAHFKPSAIRWSQRPDTLHLPGHDKGRSALDVQLPQYYREGYFAKDTLFHPELPGGRQGIAGDPVPYSAANDSIVSSMLLACFVLTILSVAFCRDFIIRQAKGFLFLFNGAYDEVKETTVEMAFMLYQVLQTSFVVALIFFFYSLTYYGETFIFDSLYTLLAVYVGMVVTYFLVKAIVYALVNMVFFDSKRNGQWQRSYLFITSFEGLMLFPILLLHAYYDIDMQIVLIYFGVTLIIVKILTIFKCYVIFFSRNVVKLQIILYFCTLEIVPLLSLWGTLDITASYLNINF